MPGLPGSPKFRKIRRPQVCKRSGRNPKADASKLCTPFMPGAFRRRPSKSAGPIVREAFAVLATARIAIVKCLGPFSAHTVCPAMVGTSKEGRAAAARGHSSSVMPAHLDRQVRWSHAWDGGVW